jgi:glycosyltransferase involved in cell wall biosynthesis
MDLSVVIPVFNEAEGLPELRRRLTDVLEKAQISFEVILIDDGSQDNSRYVMAEFHQQDERFRALCLSRNFGHQIAITAGLMHARGDVVAIMDADLQDPPEVLSVFWTKLQEGYDVVYGVRRKRKESVFKRMAYYVFYRLLSKLSDFSMPLDSGDFCLMTRRIVNHLNKMPESHRYLRGLRAWSGFRQTGIEYERESRYTGTSKYTLTKLFNLALDGLISFSAIPVRFIIQFQ